jgi:nitrogen fixation-related uncharacterized protein
MLADKFEEMTRKPSPWYTLVPLWVIGTILMIAVAILAVAVTWSFSSQYDMPRLREAARITKDRHSTHPTETERANQ